VRVRSDQPFRRRILSSIAFVGILSCIGYVLSVVRDSVLARYYGGSSALDLYFVALSPSLFVGMEAASLAYLAFLPEFSLAAGGQHEYRAVLRSRIALVARVGGLASLGIAAIGVVFAPLLAPGHAAIGAIGPLRATFIPLSLVVPCLAVIGVLRASLEVYGRFAPWALLPGFRSAVLIACVLLGTARPAIGWLVGGTLLGLLLALVFFFLVDRLQDRGFPKASPSSTRIPIVLPASIKPLLGAIVVGQITAFVDNAFASKTGVGGVQSFVLASNLLSVPQTVIAGAVTTVYYPLFGNLWAANQRQEALRSLRRSARLIVLGLLPVVVVLILGGSVVVRIVYQHGTFDDAMTVAVSGTLAALAIGQVAYASAVLLRQFLVVAGAPWAAFQGAGVFLTVKVIGNAIFTPHFGLPGIALASSIAALTMCLFLALRVRRMAHRWA
jgi:putative peptidoglycan lipid II flippase